MQNEEYLKKQLNEANKEQAEKPAAAQKDDWRSELHTFFDQVKREDQAFSDSVTQIAHFYSDTVRPALEEVSRELRLYGRECETGEDAGRVYIIIRAGNEKVEFQYAVVAEAKIEGATPYVHCWYEEQSENTNSSGEQQNSREADDDEQQDQQKNKKQGDDQQDDDQQDDDQQDDEKSEDKKTPETAPRIKTVEILTGWTEGRRLQSITREEIIEDFVAHYKNAVTQLRASLHNGQKVNQR